MKFGVVIFPGSNCDIDMIYILETIMNRSKPEEKLILALDHMSESELFSLIEKLPKLIWVKVGLELFTLYLFVLHL